MPIKTLESLEKMRVGRETGNTYIYFFFWPYSIHVFHGPVIFPNMGDSTVLPKNRGVQNKLFYFFFLLK